jgi:membrane associated rhomboid family serine protease
LEKLKISLTDDVVVGFIVVVGFANVVGFADVVGTTAFDETTVVDGFTDVVGIIVVVGTSVVFSLFLKFWTNCLKTIKRNTYMFVHTVFWNFGRDVVVMLVVEETVVKEAGVEETFVALVVIIGVDKTWVVVVVTFAEGMLVEEAVIKGTFVVVALLKAEVDGADEETLKF